MSWSTGGSVAGLIGDSKRRGCDSSQPASLLFSLPRVTFAAPTLPFASISMASASRKEHSTGIEFPGEVCNKAKPCPSLLGLGVRNKRLLGIKNLHIYALGVYADPAAVKRALGPKYKGQGEAQLAGSQALLDDVVASTSFEKGLRLVISFGHLKRQTFVEALEERLEPRMKKEGDMASLSAFKKQFDDVHFSKGMEILFVQEGPVLITKVDGKKAGAITSPSLCKSLFDIYLGPDPVAPEAKTSFAAEVARAVKA